jgi:hypothetical protein
MARGQGRGRRKARKASNVAQRAREVSNASKARRARRRVQAAVQRFQFSDLINTYSVIAVGVVLAVGLGVGAMALFGPDEEERRRMLDESSSALRRLQKRLPSTNDLGAMADTVSAHAQKIAKSARDTASRYSWS